MSFTARLALNNCTAAHCGPSVNILLDTFQEICRVKRNHDFKIPKFQIVFSHALVYCSTDVLDNLFLRCILFKISILLYYYLFHKMAVKSYLIRLEHGQLQSLFVYVCFSLVNCCSENIMKTLTEAYWKWFQRTSPSLVLAPTRSNPWGISLWTQPPAAI